MSSGAFLKIKTPNVDLILAVIEPDELLQSLIGFGVNLLGPEPLVYALSIARIF